MRSQLCASGLCVTLLVACSESPQPARPDGRVNGVDAGTADRGSTSDGPGTDQGADDDGGSSDVAGGTDAGGASDGSVAADSSITCSGSGLQPGVQTLTLQHDGVERSYRLHVPTGYDHSRPVPLVLNFHGLTGTPDLQALSSAMDADSDSEGFVVAYPAGVQNSWNAGTCCGEAARTNVDDVGFARAVVADLKQKLCIDPRRVYATGMSNGGFMSHRLACEAADLFAAIGPVAGALGVSNCQPSRPVPVIHFHGTEDGLVDYDTLALNAIAQWVTANGCTDAQPAETYNQGDVRCETYSQCQAGVEVTLCTVTGGGHCWPGRPTCVFGNPTTDISANEAMWDAFSRFPLP